MNKHFTAAVVVSLAIGFIVTGCGDDDGDELSASEFESQANEICITGDQEISAAMGEAFANEEPTPEQMQEALDVVIAVSNQQLDDIEALAAPSEIQEDVDALIAEGRSATEAAEAQGLGFFEADDDPWAKTGELAVALGLDACGSE